MYKIAVIGDYDSIYGFAAVGLDTFPVKDHTQAVKQLRQLVGENYAIIYITEALAGDLTQELDRYSSDMLPAIVPIPGVYGNTGAGMANVKRFVEQAVGSDIIFNNENQTK